MKKSLWVITLWIASLIPTWIFAANITNIYEAVDFIKETIDFDNVNINSNIPYTTFQEVVYKYCPAYTVDQANKELEWLKSVWDTYSWKPNAARALSDTFDLIKWIISDEDRNNQDKYCNDSYLLFSELQTTQDLYNQEKGINKSTKKAQTKKDTSKPTTTITNTTTSHNSAPNINFTFKHDTSGLPSEAKKAFSNSTENYLQDIMADLVNIHILDQNDLNVLNNKIEVTYQQSCEITEWSFRVVRNKQTWKVTFKEIKLIIAYCDKNNTPERQKRHVQQILAHELWHYIYFFKDKNPSNFSKICWDNWKMNCLPEDFVSNYARKSQEEDYAESFAYWYLYNSDDGSDNSHGSAPDNPINRRSRYFEELFEEEDDDDDDDEEEKK